MSRIAPDPLERRLRLLVAREFASRGYGLDVEGMYENARVEAMTPEELELLANVAAQRGDWSRAEKRFELLAEKSSEPESRSRARELAAYACDQMTKPQGKAGRTNSIAALWWRILLALLVGAATATLILWAAGMVAVPPTSR